MKRKVQSVLLILFLFALIPCAVFALMLAVAATATGIDQGFVVSDVAALLMLFAAVMLPFWGIRLLLRLRSGYDSSTRRRLAFFYATNALYCSQWVFSGGERDGLAVSLFVTSQRVAIGLVLMLPLVVLAFVKPDQTKSEG